MSRSRTTRPEDGTPHIAATLHKYLYVGGDPTTFIDPTGREEEAEGAGIIKLDLAPVVTLEEGVQITGTVEIQSGTATVFVNLIQGVIKNPFAINELLAKAVVGLGASEMYIVATLANEQLENVLVNRYGWLQVGGQLVWYQKF